MWGDLGARLIEAEILSPEEVRALQRRAAGSDLTMVEEALASGVDERALLKCLRSGSVSYVGRLTPARIEARAFRAVPSDICSRHCALPFKVEDGFLWVAFADPTDALAVDSLEKASGRTVRPVLARAGRIRELLSRVSFEEEAPPASVRGSKSPSARTWSSPGRASVKRLDSWVVGPRGDSERPSPIPDLGGSFAAMRVAEDRDRVVSLACETAATFAEAAVFLVRDGATFRGWDCAGARVFKPAVRRLVLPLRTESRFRECARSGVGTESLHGSTAVDRLFKLAVESRGGNLRLYPVVIGRRVLGMLCVDGVNDGANPRRLLDEVARLLTDRLGALAATR